MFKYICTYTYMYIITHFDGLITPFLEWIGKPTPPPNTKTHTHTQSVDRQMDGSRDG